MAKEKDVNEKEKAVSIQQQTMMTQEEYDKLTRNRRRERIYRIARIVGIATIMLLIYVGLIDLLFELSFFGAIFSGTRQQYIAGWNAIIAIGRGDIEIAGTDYTISSGVGKLFDDVLEIGGGAVGAEAYKGAWLAQIGVTAILITIVVFSVYILTYSVMDIVQFFKNFGKTAKSIKDDLFKNVKEGLEKAGVKSGEKKPKKKLDLSNVNEKTKESIEPEKKEKQAKRRKAQQSQDNELAGYTPEQIDAMLRGEEIPLVDVKPIDEVPSNETKSLF